MSRKKPNPFADLPGELRRAVAADPVAIVLSHAFEGTPGTPCRTCMLPFSHPVHAHGEPGNEVVVSASTPPRSPAVGRKHAFDCLCRDCVRAAEQRLGMPRTEELHDVLRMLEQALAYSGATDRERCEREELLRKATETLRNELGRQQR